MSIARWIRRFSVPIALFWLVLAVVLTVFVPQLEKVAAAQAVPLAPADAPSVSGMKRIGEKFNEYDSDNLVLVTIVGDEKLGQDAHDYYDELVRQLRQDTDNVQNVLDFWGHRFTASGVESFDHKAAYVQVNLVGNQGGARGNKSVHGVRDIVENSQPPPGVKAYVAGEGALTADTIEAGDASIARMTVIALIVITLMLFFFYRSIVTVLLMLFIVFVELFVSRGLIAFLGLHGLIGLSTFAVNLLTILVIAAGTDYAIFIIGRYHERRSAGMDRETAYFDSFTGVSKVILGSGLTIVGATYCLTFTKLPYINSVGVPCSIGLLALVAAAVTLGPAVLAVASRFGLLEPKRQSNYRRWRRIGTAIVRWPGPVLATSLTLTIVGTAGLIGFEPLYNERYYLPERISSRMAYDAAGEHFTEARLNPDVLMIETDHDLRNPRDLIVLDRVWPSTSFSYPVWNGYKASPDRLGPLSNTDRWPFNSACKAPRSGRTCSTSMNGWRTSARRLTTSTP